MAAGELTAEIHSFAHATTQLIVSAFHGPQKYTTEARNSPASSPAAPITNDRISRPFHQSQAAMRRIISALP